MGSSERMAVCTDPNGVGFDVWEPKNGLGTGADSSRHGAPSWFESTTTDVDRAAKFYAGLFGWPVEVMSMPDVKYTTFKLRDAYVAGMMQTSPQMGNMVHALSSCHPERSEGSVLVCV